MFRARCSIHLIDPMKQIRVDHNKVVEKWGVPANKLGDVLALAGDTADNVPGVKGIGPKIAAELINTYIASEKIDLAKHTTTATLASVPCTKDSIARRNFDLFSTYFVRSTKIDTSHITLRTVISRYKDRSALVASTRRQPHSSLSYVQSTALCGAV